MKNNKTIFWGVIGLAISIVIFIAGLWPFSFHPENKVEWLPEKNGLGYPVHLSQKKIKKLKGKIHWEGNLDKMRRD